MSRADGGREIRNRADPREHGAASQVAASQNSAPVNSLAPVKFLLDSLQFRLDLGELTAALNRALRII